MARDDAAGAAVVDRRPDVAAGPDERCAEEIDLAGLGGAARGLTPVQWLVAAAFILSLGAALDLRPAATLGALHGVGLVGFAAAAIWRLACINLARRAPAAPEPLAEVALPSYTIVAPLYREAAMVGPLLRALEAIDYPRDRLQLILALESDDADTRAAVDVLAPPWVEVVLAPTWAPRTKPRACNVALAEARGERLVIYDAEDVPAPDQLRRAAACFVAGPASLAALQAPLRVPLAERGLIARQFAFEYAAQFEVMLPALARLGAPFPLGGSSNHFRTAALRAVGGWDPYNVTEDADLGFRLAAAGYRVDMLASATEEPPPERFRHWLPQRTRWLKGYAQTWAVHMRRPAAGGWARFAALQATLGLAMLSALLHGPAMLAVMVEAVWAFTRGDPSAAWPDWLLLALGWAASVTTMGVGARRAGTRLSVRDALAAPLYWPLQSLAACRAVRQLVREPHRWEKTPHTPPPDYVPPPPTGHSPGLDAPEGWSVSPAE